MSGSKSPTKAPSTAGAGAGAGRQEVGFRQGKHELPDAARLGEPDSGSGCVADAVRGRLGFLAQADDQQPLRLQPGWGVQQQRLVGAGFEFAARQDGGGRFIHGGIAGEQFRRGLYVRALLGLGVHGHNGQQFSLNLGERRVRQFRAHSGIISFAARRVTRQDVQR